MRIYSEQFRPWHILPSNKGCVTPASCLFFDTETTPTVSEISPDITMHNLRLWQAIHCRLEKGESTRRKEHGGIMASSFWEMLQSKMDKRKLLWAFAHNLIFDLTELKFWDYLEEGKLSVRCIPPIDSGGKRRKSSKPWDGLVVLNNPPVIIECCRPSDGAKVVFLDTLNWFRCSLARLGESMGLAKLPMPDFAETNEIWSDYCKRDCEVIERAILSLVKMVRDKDLGNFRYTASSQAMGAYRHRFMPTPIVIHGSKDAIKLERDGYFGGECRVFQKVKVIADDDKYNDLIRNEGELNCTAYRGVVYVLDCQSFYPSMMQYGMYPRKLSGVEYGITPKQLWHITDSALVVASVRLNSAYNSYPKKLDNFSASVKGKFDTTLCTPEIRKALLANDVTFVGQVAIYESAQLFTDYVNNCYNERKLSELAGKPEIGQLWKLLGNSLFGKFGQRLHKWEADGTVDSPQPWGTFFMQDIANDTYAAFRSIAWQAQRMLEKGESMDSFPAIPAHVTSYGRIHMERLRMIAGSKNVLYQDTDSIHVLHDGYMNLLSEDQIEDDRLGYLKLIKIVKDAEYIAPKHYWHDGHWTVAGISKKAKYLGNETWQQEQWDGIGSIMSASPPNAIAVRKLLIDRSKDMIPGVIADNGMVSPITLSEW